MRAPVDSARIRELERVSGSFSRTYIFQDGVS